MVNKKKKKKRKKSKGKGKNEEGKGKGKRKKKCCRGKERQKIKKTEKNQLGRKGTIEKVKNIDNK